MAVACKAPPDSTVSEMPVPQPPAGRPEVARLPPQPVEASQPMKVGGEVSAPKPITRWKRPWPDDPSQCYELGVVVLEGVVDKSGNVQGLKLIKGPNTELTRAVRDAVAQQKFEPAIYRGKPADVIYSVAINHVPLKKVKGPC